MGYSYKKSMALKPRKELWLSTFLLALLTASVIFAPFVIMDKGYFTFYGDFNVQQIPFYRMCHDAVRSGRFGWNSLTDLGTDLVSSYSFYLMGSPFFWLTIPFTGSAVPYLMAPLLVLKFACAALTAYLYIRRFTRTPEAARLGGILYAFSGFSIYNVFFNHFHEAIIIFPLFLLAFELILTENKHGLFAVCVFLSAGINYFFFYGMVIFTIIYIIIRVCSKAVKISFGKLCLIALEAVIGLAGSAIIMLPTFMALITNSRLTEVLSGWSAIMYGKEQIYLNVVECFFFPPDLPARPVFFPQADVKWSSLGGWLPLMGMTGVLTYCSKNKGNWLKRIICTSFVFAMFPILNSAFSLFNTAYYARWFYMPVLMMCLATVMATEDREISFKSSIKWTMFITAAFAIVIGLFPNKTESGYKLGLFTDGYASETYTVRFWTTCLIAIMSIIITAVMLAGFKKRNHLFFNVAVVIVCIISVVYGMIFIDDGRSCSYDQRVLISSLIEGEVNLPGEKDNFRIDTYKSPDNTAMFLGYSSINAFHSIVPDTITEFYKFVGEKRSVASRPSTENYALRNLLSVRYLLNLNGQEAFEDENKSMKMPGYKYFGEQSGFKIYENQNFIPYGFIYDKYITYSACSEYRPVNRANIMLKAIVLSDEQTEKYKDILEPLDTMQLFSFSEEETEKDCKKLRDSSALSFSNENNRFVSIVNSKKPTLVFFSVPYAKGWTAKVNDKPVQIEKVNVGFMAVEVDAGDSKIEFTYKTPYLALGINTSIAAGVIFAVYILMNILTRKRKKEDYYPEGEQLIERWIAYDISDTLEDNESEVNQDKTKTSLDSIAEQLVKEYPINNNEFTGGFIINLNNPDDKKGNT